MISTQLEKNLQRFLDDNNIMCGSLNKGQLPEGKDHSYIIIVPSNEMYEAVEKLIELAKTIKNDFLSYFEDIDDIHYSESAYYTDCCETYVIHDDYGTQDYYIDDYKVLCFHCMKDDDSMKEDYIDWLVNNHNQCNVALELEDFEKFGYVELYNFEFASGMYGYSSDITPDQIDEILSEFDYFYNLNTAHMFNTEYTLVVKKEDLRKIIKLLKADSLVCKSHRRY